MWERSILKSNAKVALSGRYWLAFSVCLVAGILTGMCNSGSTAQSIFQNMDLILKTNLKVEFASVLTVLVLMGFILGIFVVNIITIGQNRFFVHNHFGDSRFETLFSGFSNGYMNCVGACIVTDIFIGLWTLLFIIPGIIKSYQYYFVTYILSDNPDMPGARARELSRIMTDGEKMNIFVLGLSFMGWYLLGVMCLLVGSLFVNPYYEATQAELYIFLRDRAIQSGKINPVELSLQGPAYAAQPVAYPVYPQDPNMQ